MILSLLFCLWITTSCDSGSSSTPGSEQKTFLLTLEKSGNGIGTIRNDTGSLDCGAQCSASFAQESLVPLTATAAPGSVFGGWSGEVSPGNSPHTGTVRMDQAKTVTALFNPEPTSSDLIQPETDFEYLGAFKLPDEQGASQWARWSGGGHGMSFWPDGNPAAGQEAFPGSLFSISHTYANHVSEFSIPLPVISPDKNLDDLPRAQTLQTFYDITEGRQTLGLTGTTLGDLQYLPKQGTQTTDKLYWTLFEYYLPKEDAAYHGWAELNLSSPASHGLWRLGNHAASATSKYLFEIPASWSDTYTPGKRLAGGRFRVVNGGSWGPALYTFGPWNDGNPPEDGRALAATELLKYKSSRNVSHFSFGDDWVDGAWLTLDGKSAVMIAGKRGYRTKASELGTYGTPQPDDYGSGKGYHSSPYYAAALFYDPFLLAKVARGELEAGAVQPYAVWNLQSYLFTTNLDLPVQGIRTRGKAIGGIGYDRENQRLYMIEGSVEGYYSPGKPIVHVFRLKNAGLPPDRTPPSSPANLRLISAGADTVRLAWDAATDKGHLAGYIVYRDNFPIDAVVRPEYTDDRVNPQATYSYTVRAWDARDNRSEPGPSLQVSTPPGTDTRIPIITDIHITDIRADSAVVNWKTDEPASAVIRYGAQYNVNKSVSRNEPATRHSLQLTGLTDAPDYGSYSYEISCTDSAGNTNTYPSRSLRTAKSTADNAAPVLNGIGAQRLPSGETFMLAVEGIDLDRADVLTFSATGLPGSAQFDSTTRIFTWTPEEKDRGSHTITFSVSDGDQEDQETVTFFVE